MGKWIGIGLFGLAGVLGLMILVIALGIVGSIISGGSSAQACSTNNAPASTTATSKPSNGSGPPPQFVPIYQAAAAKYRLGTQGPSILAAIHGIESAFGTNMNTSSAGAIGQMQFEPGTWAAYGVDANNDGKKDPYNAEDAIFGAAHYLRASGAPKDWNGAILAYNHAGWYVQEVLANAKKYNIPATGNATADNSTSDCTPSSGAGGYINPFGNGNGHWTAARTDQGVDWQPQGEQPVLAIGDAKITYSEQHTGWPFTTPGTQGGAIVYQLLSGDHKDDSIFVAEHIVNLKPVGTMVHAGDQIATALPGESWTEWGWASSPNSDTARAYSCYQEGMQTNSGKEMARFFIKLGAKPLDDPGSGPDNPTGPLC